MKSSILAALIVAAVLEVGGDAAVRRGLIQSAWPVVVLGAAMLVGYGLMVNLDRSVEFGHLMGLYITIFFLVSQVLSVAIFGERPSLSLMVGGGLIVAGGLVIQIGMR